MKKLKEPEKNEKVVSSNGYTITYQRLDPKLDGPNKSCIDFCPFSGVCMTMDDPFDLHGDKKLVDNCCNSYLVPENYYPSKIERTK